MYSTITSLPATLQQNNRSIDELPLYVVVVMVVAVILPSTKTDQYKVSGSFSFLRLAGRRKV